jgi:ABC-type molybdate transport system permease subunit
MTAYQEIRAAGRSMHQKCLEASRHLDFHPARIAKRMTLPTVGKTLVESVEQEYRDVV